MATFLSAAKWPQVRRLIRRIGTQGSDRVACRPGWAHRFSGTELRRGMRDARGDSACDGKETEMGGLPPRGEPDIFSCNRVAGARLRSPGPLRTVRETLPSRRSSLSDAS